MIDATEIAVRARRLALRPEHVEKDYVLNHLLAAIAGERIPLVFRGGTALARAYWPDFRLSEDLDFIVDAESASVRDSLVGAAKLAATRTGFGLRLDFRIARGGWARSSVRWEESELIIDVNGPEQPALPSEPKELDLPYSDLKGEAIAIPTVALDEILGNKWYMLDDREEPRDLYDVWAGLCLFDVPFPRLAHGHKARYGFQPLESQLKKARRLERLWEIRLVHQVADLPPFEEAYGAVREMLEKWVGSRD